jgi:hypothetical protein
MKRNSSNLYGSRPVVFGIKQTDVIQSTQVYCKLVTLACVLRVTVCTSAIFSHASTETIQRRDNKSLRRLFLQSLTLERVINTGRNM